MYLLRYVWYDIDDVIMNATGIVIPWCLVITLAASAFMVYALALSASGIASIARGKPAVFRFGGAVLPAIGLLLWGGLGAALFLETKDSVWFTPAEVYTLPDPLALPEGARVPDPGTWMKKRRPEILRLFEDQVYGRVPAGRSTVTFRELSRDDRALGGRAVRKETAVRVAAPRGSLEITVLLYLPANRAGQVPAFLGMNFHGNHTVHPDPGIGITKNWVRNSRRFGIRGNLAGDASRGVRSGRWPVERIVERGYALATAYYGDADPDFDDGFHNGAHPLFYEHGRLRPGPGEWGSIAAWSWGLSRILEYLLTEKGIDGSRVIVMGHSRLGKAALWAGAVDTRFAAVISNNSGHMGAALSRRRYGETVALINKAYPHWFCENFTQYNEREDDMPVDQHMLLALIAPRPVYVAGASGDAWSDPEGEFLAAFHAGPVYRLFGFAGLPGPAMPDTEKPLGGRIGYHLRTGRHDVTAYDWERFMDWADREVAK
jgi:hypothetical protein